MAPERVVRPRRLVSRDLGSRVALSFSTGRGASGWGGGMSKEKRVGKALPGAGRQQRTFFQEPASNFVFSIVVIVRGAEIFLPSAIVDFWVPNSAGHPMTR